MEREPLGARVAYWTFVALLIGFGFLAAMSIGAPFLLFGLALAVLYPLRHRAAAFWPPLAGLGAFVVGYVLVAPLGCTSTARAVVPGRQVPPSHTTCTTLLGHLVGLHYEGTGAYTPSPLPALLIALALGLAIGLGLRALLRGPRAGARAGSSLRA